jgi:hypothetical protein
MQGTLACPQAMMKNMDSPDSVLGTGYSSRSLAGGTSPFDKHLRHRSQKCCIIATLVKLGGGGGDYVSLFNFCFKVSDIPIAIRMSLTNIPAGNENVAYLFFTVYGMNR